MSKTYDYLSKWLNEKVAEFDPEREEDSTEDVLLEEVK